MLFAAEELGQDVVAEVVLGVGIFSVRDQRLEQRLGVEDVDAHGARSLHAGLKGERKLVAAGFSWKPSDLAGWPTSTTPKRETSSGGNGQRGQGDIGLGFLMCWPACGCSPSCRCGRRQRMMTYLGCSLPME